MEHFVAMARALAEKQIQVDELRSVVSQMKDEIERLRGEKGSPDDKSQA